jgi:hypothetical protein
MSSAPASKAPETVRLPLGVVEQILGLSVPLPTTVADVDNTLAALAAMRSFWQRRQAEEMRKGEEEERLERESDAAGATVEAPAPAAEATADAEEKEEGEL